MKLNQKSPSNKVDPSEKLSDELIFDQTFFNKHQNFIASVEDNILYIVPACDIENIRILKIENANKDERLRNANGNQLSAEDVMRLLSDMLNERKLQLVEFDANLLKSTSKQITFKAI